MQGRQFVPIVFALFGLAAVAPVNAGDGYRGGHDHGHHGYRHGHHLGHAPARHNHHGHGDRHRHPVCHNVSYTRDRHGNLFPILAGSVIGGVIGHEVGHSDRSTAAGAVIGTVVGYHVARDHRGREVVTQRECR